MIPVARQGETILYAESEDPDAKALIKQPDYEKPVPLNVSVASVMARGYWVNIEDDDDETG